MDCSICGNVLAPGTRTHVRLADGAVAHKGCADRAGADVEALVMGPYPPEAPAAHVTLRRGAATVADLSAALDRLGVARGEDFALVPAAAFTDERMTDLDGLAQPHAAGSDTSKAAALDNLPRAGTQARRVLEAIAHAADATADEVQEALGLPAQSVTARIWQLDRGGFVQATGETRATVHGSQARVLELTPKAYDELAIDN